MERTKNTINRLILTIILFAIAPEIYPESPYRKTIYNSFINREMYKWGAVIRTIEASNTPINIDQKLEYIDYYYGYVAHLIGKKQYDEAEIELKRGEKLINQVIRTSPRNATAYAYKGAFVGFRIGISKLKSIYLSSESTELIDKALELDPQNIQATIDKGNSLYFRPRFVGGDKKEALSYYLKALRLLESKKDTYQNWKYINLLTIIAIAYDKVDMLEESKLTYEKILRKEPNYKWVRDDLYPKLMVKLKNE